MPSFDESTVKRINELERWRKFQNSQIRFLPIATIRASNETISRLESIHKLDVGSKFKISSIDRWRYLAATLELLDRASARTAL